MSNSLTHKGKILPEVVEIVVYRVVDYSRVKEWRVTLGITLSVSAISSFVPV